MEGPTQPYQAPGGPDLCILRKITGRGEIDPGISIPNLSSLSSEKAFMQE
jgi:hypothetical protein